MNQDKTIQQTLDYKPSPVKQHIKDLALTLLRHAKLQSNSQTLILTSRAQIIFSSILTDSEIYSCGFNRIIPIKEVIENPYRSFQDAVLATAFTTHQIGKSQSGQQDIVCQCSQEIMTTSSQLKKIWIINLNISSKSMKQKLKSLELNKNSIKSYKEENLDFICYLNNVYKLSTNFQNIYSCSEKKYMERETTAIDRLCSFLLADQINQFQFYVPKEMGMSSKGKSEEGSQRFQEKLQKCLKEKLEILEKYGYKFYKKEAGFSKKTKVVIFERVQDLSPFIYSLNYGALIQQLKLARVSNLLSVHSQMFNSIYQCDIMQAAQKIEKYAQAITGVNKNSLQTNDFEKTKKVILTAYNPNLTKEEIKIHQSSIKQALGFAQKNKDLLILQQNIANGISDVGEKMRGSKIISDIFEWMASHEENGYQKYIGLAMMAFMTHNFWWYQRGDLQSPIEKKDENAFKNFKEKCKKQQCYRLEEVPPIKDSQGVEERTQYFRHRPQILSQIEQWKQNPTKNHKILSLNKAGKSKKTRTIIYINSPVGYGELAMLLKEKMIMDENIQIVCRDLKSVREWIQYELEKKLYSS